MQRTPNQDLIGHRLGVVAVSPLKRRYVPLDGATLYTLFPDTVRQRGQIVVVLRLGAVRLQRAEDGKITGRCSKWWDIDKLQSQQWVVDPGSVSGVAVMAKNLLLWAMERNYVSPFGDDLPLYLDVASSRNRAYDWETLEWDVFRGLNSQVPFRYKLSRRTKGRITSELPFLDMKEHFRTVMPDDMCMNLIRQLLSQHTKSIGPMSLVPLRWIDRVNANDTVVVETDVPFVINMADVRRAEISVGAMRVGLAREPRRRRGPHSARCKQ